MRIPEEKIEEVRRSADIVDVITGFVPLKKRGKNYTGLCPFHQEKTPSFSVSSEKQMFYCFGCGVGGNVFSFLMQHDKISFLEAVRTLAERFGIVLPSEKEEDQKALTENEEIYAVCQAAGRRFRENLTSTVEGKLALEYFRHRGFSDATMARFGLGYAMNSWDDLIRFAEKERIAVGMLEKAGLVVKRDEGPGYYDRFRGRTIFPILSATGRMIGFGARKMREDDPLGKYINSPETAVYNKSRTLYGLFHAREAIRARGYAVMVEGYADLISPFQAGIENIVASSGTALTVEQIQLLSRYAKSITLVYDADSAGSRAALRGVDLVLEQGLDVRVARLPEGEDPDSFVRARGGDAFQRLIDGAVSFLDFKASLFQEEGRLETPEGKTQAIRSLVESIARIGDELKRNVFIQSVGEKYGLYETVLHRELDRVLAEREHTRRAERVPVDVRPPTTPAGLPPVVVAAVSSAEKGVVKAMLEGGNEVVRFVFSHITPDFLVSPMAQDVARRLLTMADADVNWTVGSLVDGLPGDDMKRFVTDLVFTRYELSKGWSGMGRDAPEADAWTLARDAILALKHTRLDALLAEQARLMREAEMRGEDLTHLHQLILALQQEKKDLRDLWRTEEGI